MNKITNKPVKCKTEQKGNCENGKPVKLETRLQNSRSQRRVSYSCLDVTNTDGVTGKIRDRHELQVLNCKLTAFPRAVASGAVACTYNSMKKQLKFMA